MGENQNSFEDTLGSLALIVEGVQKIYPESKSVIIYELNLFDFTYLKSNFKYIKIDENQIKIDISGTEIIFILENSYKIEEKQIEEETEEKQIEVKKNLFQKILNKLTFKKSS